MDLRGTGGAKPEGQCSRAAAATPQRQRQRGGRDCRLARGWCLGSMPLSTLPASARQRTGTSARLALRRASACTRAPSGRTRRNGTASSRRPLCTPASCTSAQILKSTFENLLYSKWTRVLTFRNLFQASTCSILSFRGPISSCA